MTFDESSGFNLPYVHTKPGNSYGHHNICRIQCPFLIKSLIKLGMKGNFLILIKSV